MSSTQTAVAEGGPRGRPVVVFVSSELRWLWVHTPTSESGRRRQTRRRDGSVCGGPGKVTQAKTPLTDTPP